MTRSHEDALRDALRTEADGIEPTPSFADVEARRRTLERRTTTLRAAAIVVVVLGVGALSPWLAGGDGGSREVDVVDRPDTTTTPTTATVDDDILGIWPFATAAEADAAAGAVTSPDEVAAAFLAAVAGRDTFARVEVVDGDAHHAVVFTSGRGLRRTQVELVQIGSSGRWTVVHVAADGLEIDAPEPGTSVTSPVRVAGRATAFEGTVQLQMITGGGTPPETLGEGFATGQQGELRPFEGELPFGPTPASVAAVVATTTSPEDGSTEQVAAVPVRVATDGDAGVGALPAGEPLADDELVVVVTVPVDGDPDEHAVEVRGDNDDLVRMLYRASTVEGGVLDLALTPDRRTVFVAEATSACDSRVAAIAADGSAGVVPLGDGEQVAVSPDGSRLAVAVDGDCDGHHAIEIREVGGEVLVRYGEDATPTTGLPATIEEELIAKVDGLVWTDEDSLAYSVRYEDGPALFVLDVGGKGRRDERLREADSISLWWDPVRDSDGKLTFLAQLDGGGVEVRTLDGRLASIGEAIGHAWRGRDLLWMSADGDLHRVRDGVTEVVTERVAHIAA